MTEVKTDLFDKLSKEKAQDQFYQQTQEMARVSFEFPDSLDDAASTVNASIETSQWLARNGNPAPFDDVKVIEAAFSDLVLQDNMNSDVVELSDSVALVLRLNAYQEANVKPLEEVTASITSILVAQKATEQAQSIIDALL